MVSMQQKSFPREQIHCKNLIVPSLIREIVNPLLNRWCVCVLVSARAYLCLLVLRVLKSNGSANGSWYTVIRATLYTRPCFYSSSDNHEGMSMHSTGILPDPRPYLGVVGSSGGSQRLACVWAAQRRAPGARDAPYMAL